MTVLVVAALAAAWTARTPDGADGGSPGPAAPVPDAATADRDAPEADRDAPQAALDAAAADLDAAEADLGAPDADEPNLVEGPAPANVRRLPARQRDRPREVAGRQLRQDGRPADAGERQAPAQPPRGFTLAASGDILPHGPVIDRAAEYGEESGAEYDFSPMFADVAPVLDAADLAICHIEVPLSADNADVFGGGDRRTPGGAPLFTSPWQLAEGVRDAGFDACSTAHNHSLDAGEEGVVATLDALDDAGVGHAGTARTPEEVAEPQLYDAGGVTVAHLSYTYGLNNVPWPEDKPWLVNIIDVDDILAEARGARAAGAEFVAVSLHQGFEFEIEPSANQRERADALLATDAVDVIIGHHAHVVQPVERIHGKVAAHGLGNFLSNMHADLSGPRTQDGVILLLDVTEDAEGGFAVDRVRYVPTWVALDSHRIVDVGTALDASDLTDGERARLGSSWDRTVDAITRDGADRWGAAPVSGADVTDPAPD